MDVFKPARANGMGVIFIVSGGWFSSHEGINPDLAKPFNDRGITVFEVVHGSQPRYHIDEIAVQLKRAIKFIRANAHTYGIEPNEIGVTGASAGGHLSLLLAGAVDKGDPNAADPINRVGSEVQSVVAFFPPTDFLNWGKPDYQPFDVPVMQIFIPAFGIKKDATKDDIKKLAVLLSPITYVTPQFPPTLIFHGDKDPLVPIQQSQTMDAALAKAGVQHLFVTVPGLGHDPAMIAQKMGDMVSWFEKTLKKS